MRIRETRFRRGEEPKHYSLGEMSFYAYKKQNDEAHFYDNKEQIMLQ